jgi:hypothetical protein
LAVETHPSSAGGMLGMPSEGAEAEAGEGDGARTAAFTRLLSESAAPVAMRAARVDPSAAAHDRKDPSLHHGHTGNGVSETRGESSRTLSAAAVTRGPQRA